MIAHDQLEVRLLGPTVVRRRTGEAVSPKEWRTAKSLELVRLLALSLGEPVPTAVVLDRLWPQAPAKKAQASLRTATYHVRLVLGDDAIERRSDGLALHNAWTDADSYSMLADEIEAARRADQHLRVASLSQEAEALYVRDIDIESSGDWLIAVQQRWRELRLAVLLASAESAAALGCMREALDFAVAVWSSERSSERAVRIMMRAYGALGEIEKALSAYERLRSDLAELYGVDPAPQTRALHLQLLTGTAGDAGARGGSADGVIGHEDAVDTLTAALLRVVTDEERRSGVMWVLGEAGSGRASVVRAACRRARLTVRLTGTTAIAVPSQRARGSVPVRGDVLICSELSRIGSADVGRMQARAVSAESLLVVLAEEMSPQASAAARESGHEVVTVEALGRAAVEELVQQVLQGAPAPALLEEVLARTAGRAGEVRTTIAEWLDQGRIMWAPEGMSLVGGPDAVPVFRRSSSRVLRSLGALDPHAVEALSVVAVIGSRVTAPDVDAVLNKLFPQRALESRDLLDRLVDAGLLRVAPGGYHMRNDQDRREIFAWLRPAALRRLHVVVAQELVLDARDHVLHLMASGQHQLACDIGVAALRRACDHDDVEHARELIDVLGRLPERMLPSSTQLHLGVQLSNYTEAIELRASA